MFAGAAGVLLLFFITGSFWVTLVTWLPAGIPRGIVAILFGIIFGGLFLWLLISRVQRLYAGRGDIRVEMAMALTNVFLLLLAFALIYRRLGVYDSHNSAITNTFWDCLYYSFVTFTTLGYGDLYPQGLTRALACIQAFTGYIVLGLLASTSASLLESRAEKRLEEQKQKD